MTDTQLLRVENLVKYFPLTGGFLQHNKAVVKAVDGVSFTVDKGKTLGLVGESGCGKSTLGRCILRLQEPTAGDVFFQNKNILRFGGSELKKTRKDMQIIFQDPYSSLNPRMTVYEILREPL